MHESAKPGELNVSGDFVVKTETGAISTRPLRSTIARTVHEGLNLDKDSTADTKDKRNQEIYEEKSRRLPSLFNSVFSKLLEAGLALVGRAKLKDDKWRTALSNLARKTWAKYLKGS